ncbi:MAG: translation initiation factor IF-3 [Clostridia bacterium]|nr:translation initiation factor IF-3 [Clostridia bacterium]
MKNLEVLTIAKELLINEEIRHKEIRVVGEDGSQLGILPLNEAMRIADEKNLDLVEIAPQATPPVCRIMDYGKYRFDQAKREKETKKNQKIITVKEVRLTPSIDVGDLETKIKQATKFIKSGDKVKVSLRFRGRELAHTEIGAPLLDKFAESFKEIATIEKQAKMEGRSMVMYMSPKQ